MKRGFPAFRKAFAAGDYETAGNELINSQWYGQVGRRANPIVSLIKGKGTGGASYLKNIPSIRSRLSPPLPPLSNVGGMISPNTLARKRCRCRSQFIQCYGWITHTNDNTRIFSSG